MGSARKSTWVVAASIGAVEALKDQMGVCRWNFVIRSVQSQAKSNIRSFSQANKLSPYSSLALSKVIRTDDTLKQSEDSVRKVMYFSCWNS
ncbi:uncharacterized protein LOC133784248 [Humulus lupulus]|uniref:uncharacterized protein LOC133784248 n=1 Tax=Humulus lupulus TaxID=3486 RepID=UPI002B404BD9|nr:uncharacterized protein LOC133784248 [Humulus lupulus]